MKKAFLFCFSLIVTLSLFAESKREFRGAWLHIVGNTQISTMQSDEVKKMITDALDEIEASGCNAVIFQVRPTMDAFYESKIEPWSRYLTGVQGKAPVPFWDPLKFVVEESHNRGMEVHAWCNPYRVTMNEEDALAEEHIYNKHPQMFVKYGKQLYFNPTEPFAREYTAKVVADIVRRYDIEAIHFDDYFYPYPIPNMKFNDDKTFNKYAKRQGFTDRSDWRRYNVELLIKELNDTIKSIKPWVRFGISPFGIHRNKKDTPDGSGSETNGLSNYDELFADVPAWVEKGYIDYYVPQLYWKIGHDRADYTTLIKWWNKNYKKGQLYIGQSISAMDKQIKPKIKLSRDLKNVDGNVWWPGWALASNAGKVKDSLKIIYQKHSALIPAYKDLDSKNPMPLASFAKNGRNIEWTQSECDAANPMQQALFYAVYCFPKDVKVDIKNNRYLLKITNKTSFNVIEQNPDHAAGCKYVVTVIDRCWNESDVSNILWF